ncbi:uncharacterized protein LOC113853039 [Abrus precatorius]|uniref:Uncharacterized protein LOC113853039 n=1 Tax=Abrus precatorius TaxID=3816 RepID=A0A8B8K6H4_ABRPR|nr:uncharacterized protein LOC113853039 [Abrus precatorius]
MNGYSKISSGTTHKSRSMDFSDSVSFPQTPKASRNTAPSTAKPEEPNEQVKKSERELEEGGNGERFGVILGRSGSVSSASGFQATMKRAFSMRRSSSVSERYCRIHDQYMAIEDHEMDADVTRARRSMKKKQKGGKILKACKRFLGL